MTTTGGRRHTPTVLLPRGRYGPRQEHWLAARRAGITGRDAAVLLGVDPYASPLSLYVDKLTGPEFDSDAGEAAYWGSQLEHVVAIEWGKRNRDRGVILPTPGLLAHPDQPWQMATIDRYVAQDRRSRPHAVLEVKTTGAWRAEQWPEHGAPPLHVLAQVQHQLIVTGLELGYVAVLVGGQSYREWEVPFEPDLAAEITAIEAEFLDRLRRRDPPAPIGHAADDDALDALFTADGSEAVVDAGLVARRLELFAQRKSLEAEQKRLEQQIKAQLGDATEGVDESGRALVSWREQTRAGYQVPEASFRVLRFPTKTTRRKATTHADA